MKRKWWIIGIALITILLLSSLASSLVLPLAENHEIDTDIQYPISKDYFNDWHVQHENSNNNRQSLANFNRTNWEDNVSEDDWNIETPGDSTRAPMDSAWPMQGHDVVHTCRSPYITVNNSGAEIWRVHGDSVGAVYGSAIIDRDGIIYFGTKGSDSSLYALYPNGTRRWRFPASDLIWGTPTLSEDGVIYFTTWGQYFYAVNPDGTEKWLFNQESISTSSSIIGEDGTIYFGTDGHNIFAVNPNGTEKWRYTTGYIIMASPAIGNDGTIYVGSGDHYLYALFPNGTLRWRFATGGEIKGAASIATDGTIYIPSFDGYLYALYPNGTMKWRVATGSSIAAAGVALTEDGTIYIGTEQLRAFYPNGILKWSTNIQGSIYGTVPAVSADGTIYVSAGGSLVAVNPDGSERWRKQLTITQIHSSPCIGPDDRVYIGSEDYGISPYGYLHAFGLGPLRAEAGGPYQGTALRPTTLTGLAFGGIPPYIYHWDFGDGNTSTEINPTHTYTVGGNYTATFTIIDKEGNSSTDMTLVSVDYPYPTVTITRPTKALYITDKEIIPFSLPVILGKITVEVDAVQEHYGIDRVVFYVHGTAQLVDTTPPYSWTWTQRNFRLFDNIWVIAWDAKGRYVEQNIDVIKWF